MKRWIPLKKKILTLRITEEMNNDIEFQAYQLKKSTSDVIRIALENFLNKKSDKDKLNKED